GRYSGARFTWRGSWLATLRTAPAATCRDEHGRDEHDHGQDDEPLIPFFYMCRRVHGCNHSLFCGHGDVYSSSLGSNASRRPSPIKEKPNMVNAIMMVGNRPRCQ